MRQQNQIRLQQLIRQYPNDDVPTPMTAIIEARLLQRLPNCVTTTDVYGGDVSGDEYVWVVYGMQEHEAFAIQRRRGYFDDDGFNYTADDLHSGAGADAVPGTRYRVVDYLRRPLSATFSIEWQTAGLELIRRVERALHDKLDKKKVAA